MSNKAAAPAVKQGAQHLTPKLRFPEFRDAPRWGDKSLEEALSPIVREKKKPSEAYTGLGVRSHGKGTFLKKLEDPLKNAMEYLYEVECDDLILNITFAWEGAIAIAQKADTGALVSHRFPTYTFKRDVAISDFFRYIILNKRFIYGLGVISPGGAGRNRVLNKNDFLKLRVLVPDINEQQKIADCLISLDQVIAAQSQKLDALKTHKKGLMQQLFPREGENVPRLRFPEFRDAPEWIVERFESLYEFKPTNTFSRDQLNYDAGTVRNIHYGDIHTKFAAAFRIEAETVPFVDPSVPVANVRLEAYCQEGDMIFADSSEDLADVGKSIEIVSLNGERVLSGSHTILARQKRSLLVVGFGAYLFKSRGIRAQIEKEAQGTKVMAISPNRIAGIEMYFPSDEAEQEKIVGCLSWLDGMITAQSQKLAALKTHKKGLMQQLFPSPE